MAIWPDHVCRNPSCRSYGKPHPNCRCGPEGQSFAHGGTVYCSQGLPHKSDCPYYADGGTVERVHSEHALNHHGLLGLLTSVGRSKLDNPDKHSRLIDETKSHYKEPHHEAPKTMGVRLANSLRESDHTSASDMLHGHPMVGGVNKGHLKEVLGHIAGPMMEKEANPVALKSSTEFLSSAFRGHDKLKAKAKGIFGKDDRLAPDKESKEALKGFLENVKMKPESLLDVGGDLGHYLPEQATQLGAIASAATQYLESLKPAPTNRGPMDKPLPPDKMSQAKYERQLDVAQQPLLVLQHVKDGTLQPQDVVTLKTIYPQLYKSVISEVGESLVEAHANETEIPYRQRRSLSLLLGQPLDSTMTQASMQAIIRAQGPQQVQNQARKNPEKADDTELKQINKVDEMAETPLEARQIKRKM